jgi:DNA-binding transcriptional LysR family regulator
MAGTIVYDVIDRLTRRYPLITFQVVTGAGPPLFDELRTRNVEFLISRRTNQAAEEFSERERLFDDAYVVAASRNSRLARRRKIDLIELLDEPWITAQAVDGFGSTLLAEAFDSRGMRAPRATITTVSLNLRNKLLATGRFLTMVPGYSVVPNNYPFLKKLPVAISSRYAPVSVWTLRNRTLSPPAVLFIETLRAVAKSAAQAR